MHRAFIWYGYLNQDQIQEAENERRSVYEQKKNSEWRLAVPFAALSI